GHPHSDQLHVVHRLTRPDRRHISYEGVSDDPKTFTRPGNNTRTFTLRPYCGHISYEVLIDGPTPFPKPWNSTRTFPLRPGWEMLEYSGEENNKRLWE